ncbi:MAG: hypothetical protein KDC27_07345 [Acidobacteria bacterium]|nr:hypothetical protein [Acidobacteriota bacterium]
MAAFLRLDGIGAEALTGDEVFSRDLALSPWPEFFEKAKADLVHPPGYYLLLKLFLSPGEHSALAGRALSLLSGVGLVAAVALWGWRERRLLFPATVAALLVAVNETQIFYSQQTRSYALYALLVWAIASLFGRRARALERSVWPLAVLAVGAVYVHYVAGVYLAGLGAAALLGLWGKAPARRFLQAGAITVALFLPWVWLAIGVYQDKGGLEDNLGWAGVASLYDLASIYARYAGLPPVNRGVTIAVALSGAFVAYALWSLAKRRGEERLFELEAAAILAIVPPLLLFLASRRPEMVGIFGVRHLLPSQAFWAITAAYGLAAAVEDVRRRAPALAPAAAAAGLAILLSLPSFEEWALAGQTRRLPYDAVANYVAAHADAAPVYSANAHSIGLPVEYYAHGRFVTHRSPAELATAPERLLLIYRPDAPAEKEVFESLAARGWGVCSAEAFPAGPDENYAPVAATMAKSCATP